MDYYITLDVGGTQIKAGVLSASGQLFHNRMETFDSLAKKDRETILKNFFHIITYLAENLDDSHGRIIGIGLAFPGDFNYAEGICLIHDVDKYDSIYGVNLKEELKNYLEHSQAKHLFADNCPIVFLNDIEAFALGESSYGSGTGYPSVFAVCIGTGTGSAFLRHGHIIADPEPGIPEHGWIYNHPFKDSILDDYLSKRGLMNLSLKYTGEALDGRALAQLAHAGNSQAIQTFHAFGSLLLEGLTAFLTGFSPTCLLLGGQITKSFSLYGKPLTDYCRKHGIDIQIAPDTSKSSFLGLYSILKGL